MEPETTLLKMLFFYSVIKCTFVKESAPLYFYLGGCGGAVERWQIPIRCFDWSIHSTYRMTKNLIDSRPFVDVADWPCQFHPVDQSISQNTYSIVLWPAMRFPHPEICRSIYRCMYYQWTNDLSWRVPYIAHVMLFDSACRS